MRQKNKGVVILFSQGRQNPISAFLQGVTFLVLYAVLQVLRVFGWPVIPEGDERENYIVPDDFPC